MKILEIHRDAEIYDLGGGIKMLKALGDIYNPIHFDSGLRAPGTFIFADGFKQGNWTWIGKGEQGYAINPTTGTVRVFPVRGHGPTAPLPKYIQISGMGNKVCDVNQIDNKHLEIFKDQEFTRWSLKMGPQGFKPEIIIKPGWTGTPEWQFRFELNGGLSIQDAWIMDGTTRILKMQKPFIEDTNGDIFEVDSLLENGIFTLTANMDNVVLPACLDPVLSPIALSKDTFLSNAFPNNGFGVSPSLTLFATPANISRPLMLLDVSAIDPLSNVLSADLSFNAFFTSGATAQSDNTFSRMIIQDWEALGNNTGGAEANYNNYKDPNVAWPGGPGGAGDIDATVTDTNDGSTVATGQFSVSVKNNIQDAVTNRAGQAHMLWKFDDEGAISRQINMHSLESVTASARPFLTVIYIEPSSAVFPSASDVRTGIVYGPNGNDFTGTYEPALEAVVEDGVQYGAGGTEFTGTFPTFLATYELPQEIILEDDEIILFEGCEQ